MTPSQDRGGWPGTTLLLTLLFAAAHPGAVFRGESLCPGDILFPLAGWRDAAPSSIPRPANDLLSDPVFYFHPWRTLTTERLGQGRAPLWNPWNGFGAPLLANLQSAPFDPTSLPFLFLPTGAAWTATVFLRFLVAGLLTHLLAGRLGAGSAGARLAAVAYAFGGTMSAMALWPNSAAAAWFPGILLAADALARGPTLLRVAGLAIVLAATIAAGQPEITLALLVAAGPWFLFRLRGGPGDALASLSSTVLAGLVALLLTAPLTLPFFDYLPETHRFHALTTRNEAAASRYPLAAWIGLLCPGFFGSPAGHPRPTNLVWQHCLFLGAAPLLLAPLAFLRRGVRGAAALLAVLVALGALLAFATPVHAVAARLPGLRLVALNHFMVVVNLGLALLGGLGLGALLGAGPRARLLPGGTALLLVLSGAVFVHFHWRDPARLMQSLRSLGPFVLAALAVACLALRPRSWAPAALVLVAGADLLFIRRGFFPSVPAARLFPETPWTEALRREAEARPSRALGLPQVGGPVFSGVLPNALLPYRLEDAALADAMHPEEFWWLCAATKSTGPPYFLRPGLARRRLLDLLGVRHLLAPRPRRARTFAEQLLEEGRRAARDPAFVGLQRITIDGQEREVLHQHAPSSVELSLPPSEGRRLSFHLAINPQAWAADGDGVEFLVEAGVEEPRVHRLARLLDPRRRPEERRWVDEAVDLSPWAGRRVLLTLRATSGPEGNDAFDSALWGSPRIGGAPLEPGHLADAPHWSSGSDYIRSGPKELAGETRTALVTHADSEVEVPLEVPVDDPVFLVGLGLLQAAWEGSDGVLYEVLVRPAPELRPVFRRRIDPRHDPSHRAWIADGVELPTGGPLRLRLRTDPGAAGHHAFDQAGWGDLVLTPPLESVVLESNRLSVIRREGALPRAFVVHRWLPDADRERTRALLLSGATDLTRVAWVEGGPPSPAGPPPPATPAEARRTAPEELVVRADVGAEGMLIVGEAFAPGWEARVNGAPAPILRADRCLRAVHLGPGRHEVVFRYRPRAWRIGLALAAAGAAALVLLGAARAR